ncbi:MAG: DUF4071 domain-containing protein [Planctomycetes bacterium]|nr:DUF4071 domain-containing protein [Planctomycetota bacterium]
MPDIYWLSAAQRRFLEAMPAPTPTRGYANDFTRVCERLAATFPKAAAVIVRDRLRGYRNHDDRHILLVEVIHRTREVALTSTRAPGPDSPSAGDGSKACTIIWPEFCEPELGRPTQTSAHVVKIADKPGILKEELDAWEQCRPVGMTHDSILMRLRPGARGPNGELLSIIYEDAHHVIGMGLVISLEEAVIDCCRWGSPTVSSIELLIRVLYERFGADFYARSRVLDKPDDNLARLRAWKKFDEWLDKWQDSLQVGETPQLDRLRTRREVLAMLSHKRHCLIDPVDYLRSVRECPQVCPLLLWGCSDGDLHGRNVLVTVLDEDASLPAVYDYADMGLDNLVGWDFVKLETELKVRVLPLLLNGPEVDYLFNVLKFECYLAACTNAMHDQKELPKAEFDPELMRLAQILLTIRKQARRHLGVQRLRDRQWLEEYYFLLACYGVYAGLFDTYQSNRRQIAAAYISAGVAARQLSRPTQRLNELIREAEVSAKGYIDAPPPDFNLAAFELPKVKCEMSYHARLAFAKKWIGSSEPTYREAAIRILGKLRQDYPHVLEIDEELALAYLEANPTDFEQLLANVNARYVQLSEEFLCRIGRYEKSKGDKERSNNLESARRLYETALDWYQKGFAIRANYYPGINVAALQFVLGKSEQARQTAEVVLSSFKGPQRAEELPWIRATQADAQLILGKDAEAEIFYRQAVAQADARGKASIRRQVELLLAYAPATSSMVSFWTTAKLDSVFGA